MDDAARLFDLVVQRHALVVGVGHPLRGDDAAGSVIAAALQARFSARVVDAGSVPESYLGPLTAVAGRPVVFVDAVAHGARPGGWCLVPVAALSGRDADTHRPSLGLLADLLSAHRIESWVLGVEPAHTTVGAPLSDPVERATLELTGLLAAALAAEPVGAGQ
jgi:hydrogenase maturation protease